ncbi:MAG: hypothetical protein JNN30_21180 [Rhodanobacteraceae bacterium]|nr:hypothetical protein [Rhodanobacteraceae bacterium]
MNIDAISPLSEPDNLDVIGERNDGGVDMLVVTTGPLDASDETCRRLEEKLNAYLYAAVHPHFGSVYPAARDGCMRIFVSDSHMISERARALIQSFAAQALALGVEVRIGDPVAQQSVQPDRRETRLRVNGTLGRT